MVGGVLCLYVTYIFLYAKKRVPKKSVKKRVHQNQIFRLILVDSFFFPFFFFFFFFFLFLLDFLCFFT